MKDETIVLKVLREVNKRLDIKGQCKILSEGNECRCPKCQIDRMSPKEILDAIVDEENDVKGHVESMQTEVNSGSNRQGNGR